MSVENDILYKLWLNIVCKHNPDLIGKSIEKFGSAKEIYKSKSMTKSVSGRALGIRLSMASRDLDDARELLSYCRQNQIDIISIDDDRYPKILKQIYNPPQILYVRGELPCIDNLVCVAIVGSRECSDYSREFACELATDLAKSGIVVVSGMALGIDAAAHTGALCGGNITLAILAGGVDIVYPRENHDIYEEILKRGAIISERPPGTIGKPEFYSQRNRLLVGLSRGVVIVEGSKRSGTKITANWATMSDRDLFAVPGKPNDRGAELPNELIKNNAKLITSAEDIIEEYISVYPLEIEKGMSNNISDSHFERANRGVRNWQREKTVPVPKLPETHIDIEKYGGKQRIILEYLRNNNEAIHIDEISRGCGIDTTELSFLIIQLLMNRAIKEHPGEYYSL